MDRLILFRHGDAERQSASGEDFDRRLTATGRRESQETGESLAHLGFAPDVAVGGPRLDGQSARRRAQRLLVAELLLGERDRSG